MEIAVIAGMVLGVIGFIPQALVLKASLAKRIGAAKGIFATIASFVIMCSSLAFMHVKKEDLLLLYGVTMVATYCFCMFVMIKRNTNKEDK